MDNLNTKLAIILDSYLRNGKCNFYGAIVTESLTR